MARKVCLSQLLMSFDMLMFGSLVVGLNAVGISHGGFPVMDKSVMTGEFVIY